MLTNILEHKKYFDEILQASIRLKFMTYEFSRMHYNLLVISYIVEQTTVHTVLNRYFGLVQLSL